MQASFSSITSLKNGNRHLVQCFLNSMLLFWQKAAREWYPWGQGRILILKSGSGILILWFRKFPTFFSGDRTFKTFRIGASTFLTRLRTLMGSFNKDDSLPHTPSALLRIGWMPSYKASIFVNNPSTVAFTSLGACCWISSRSSQTAVIQASIVSSKKIISAITARAFNTAASDFSLLPSKVQTFCSIGVNRPAMTSTTLLTGAKALPINGSIPATFSRGCRVLKTVFTSARLCDPSSMELKAPSALLKGVRTLSKHWIRSCMSFLKVSSFLDWGALLMSTSLTSGLWSLLRGLAGLLDPQVPFASLAQPDTLSSRKSQMGLLTVATKSSKAALT
mmetsp:Transcript_33240/g.59532  ORF Transcript_33240/g.59532 Transcript_33240/m.59532 type:complete len:335 (+) Transcript_33240:251-1255(+)